MQPWLAGLKADVFCAQEVTHALDECPDWLHYGDAFRALDQRSDLLNDISGALPDHHMRFAPATRGSLQDGQGSDHPSEHGVAQWIAPGLTVVGQWQGFVHGSFRTGGWGPEPVPRSAQVTRLATAANETFVVAHTHGLRDPSGKGDTDLRRAQWERFAAAIEEVRGPGDPVVACGDMNVRPGSEMFDILGGIGLTDLVTTRGFESTRTALYSKPERHANYMLVSDLDRATFFDAPATPEVSDHRPLILSLRLG